MHALGSIDFLGKEKVVRVNPVNSEFFEQDVRAVLDVNLDTILLPKAEPKALKRLSEIVYQKRDDVGIIALIETAVGLAEAYACARARGVEALFLGAEDLTLDMGLTRTQDDQQIYFARWSVVLAARAAGIDAIDTPFVAIDEEEAFRRDLDVTRSLGFTGRACIHPLQVGIVHEALLPTKEQLEWAKKVIAQDESAREKGMGAVAVDGKMVDAPIVARARALIEKAMLFEGGAKHED
jgi:citrate lyase subunit beta/citryl-CoA lyase